MSRVSEKISVGRLVSHVSLPVFGSFNEAARCSVGFSASLSVFLMFVFWMRHLCIFDRLDSL